jgi:hypothetical protein
VLTCANPRGRRHLAEATAGTTARTTGETAGETTAGTAEQAAAEGQPTADLLREYAEAAARHPAAWPGPHRVTHSVQPRRE